MRRLLLVAALQLVALSLHASLVIEQALTTFPQSAAAGDLVSFDYYVRLRECSPVGIDVATSGRLITITLHRWTSGCIPEIPPSVFHQTIGSLAAGTYTIRVVADPPKDGEREILRQQLTVAPGIEIDSVAPRVVNVDGTSVVEIHGRNLVASKECEPVPDCARTRVRFDDREANVIAESPDKLVVVAPNHPAGTLQISVIRADNRSVVARQTVAYGGVGLRRYLVPLVIVHPWPGANGTKWSAELAITNSSDVPVTYGLPNYYGGVMNELAPHTTEQPNVYDFPYGVFLYLHDEPDARSAATLRIREVSGKSNGVSVPIPIVSEREANRGTSYFGDVSTDRRYRLTLRIYDFDGGNGRSFTVRAYADETLVGEFIDHTSYFVESPAIPTSPGFAQVDLRAALPRISEYSNVRIELIPDDFSAWALLTITDGETQQVTPIVATH